MPLPTRIEEIETTHLKTFRHDGTFPKALWVHVRWLRWIELCAKLAILPLLTFQTLVLLSVPWFSIYVPAELLYVPLIAMFSATFASNKLIRRSAHRFGQQVRENEFSNCLECGYSLRGLSDEHACPECGVEYFLPEVQIKWRDFLGDA